MGETPEELRAEIAGTRADMTATVDAIADRANPRAAARRQAGRIGQRVGSVREAVMGRVDDVTSAAPDAGSLADGLRSGPQAVRGQTRGNPLAAGLVAFGGGLLVAALIPSTEAEQRTASQLAEQAAPVLDQARHAATEVTGQLKSSAQDAASDLKDSAADAAGQVREQAAGAAGQVGDTARGAAHEVGGTARDQTGR